MGVIQLLIVVCLAFEVLTAESCNAQFYTFIVIVIYAFPANEALESQVKQLEATVATLSEENSSLVKENATLVEEKANRIAEVRQSVSHFFQHAVIFCISFSPCKFFFTQKYSRLLI